MKGRGIRKGGGVQANNGRKGPFYKRSSRLKYPLSVQTFYFVGARVAIQSRQKGRFSIKSRASVEKGFLILESERLKGKGCWFFFF